MEMLSLISQSITTATANLFVFMFCGNIFGYRYSKKRYYVLGYLVAVILMIAVNQFKNPYLNAVYSFISANAVCILLFESDLKKVWLHNLLLWFIFAFSDSGAVILLQVIKDNTIDGILSDYQLMIISNIMNIIFMFVSYRVYITVMQKQTVRTIRLKLSFFTIIMTFFEMFIIITYGIQIENRTSGIILICILIGCLLLNFYLAYILSELSDAYQYKYELSLAERMNKMHLSNYQEISQKYEEARIIIHDIKKHLMAANSLKKNYSKEYSDYLSQVYKRMGELFCEFQCSNKMLSIVLSQKIAYAKSKGIEVCMSVSDVSMNFIDDFDITAIFANLWDNAIEACEKVSDHKWISMTIRQVNSFLIIDMQNSYNGTVRRKKGELISTKDSHDGVGLKSIKSSVEKYNGVFLTKYNDAVFTSEITLSTELIDE